MWSCLLLIIILQLDILYNYFYIDSVISVTCIPEGMQGTYLVYWHIDSVNKIVCTSINGF